MKKYTVKTLSSQIKKIREELGIEQADLARAVGIEPKVLGEYETGERPVSDMPLGTAFKLIESLDIVPPFNDCGEVSLDDMFVRHQEIIEPEYKYSIWEAEISISGYELSQLRTEFQDSPEQLALALIESHAWKKSPIWLHHSLDEAEMSMDMNSFNEQITVHRSDEAGDVYVAKIYFVAENILTREDIERIQDIQDIQDIQEESMQYHVGTIHSVASVSI